MRDDHRKIVGLASARSSGNSPSTISSIRGSFSWEVTAPAARHPYQRQPLTRRPCRYQFFEVGQQKEFGTQEQCKRIGFRCD